MHIWSAGGKSIRTGRYLLMGIVNVTPDSFYDGERYLDTGKAVDRAARMAREGADVIDVGGESSRPGSKPVSAAEEIDRVVPVIEKIKSMYPEIHISCDTYKAEVAEEALKKGASIINDISAFSMDPDLLAVVKSSNCGYVLMHMKGTPEDMQKDPGYDDVISELLSFFKDKLEYMESEEIDPARTVIDPGIGFGKRLADNLEIIDKIGSLSRFGRPVMIGASRKSFIGNILGIGPETRLPGSIAAATTAYMKGARIFRVHDVAETRQALEVVSAINNRGARHPEEMA